MKEKKDLVEIWGDVVALNSLVGAILISSILTMGAFFLAPSGNQSQQLFYGLAGAVIGFIISAVLIKPKRIIVLDGQQTNEQGESD
ncbi:hypothetical protein [Carnobacterium mobile]|uniref:hypothetical protein n=1 Tax=Carnobacterium mobile TaxID=2750 RepID=UPI0005586413|nr:hypothetical protein [Carnobacterium mobile]